MFKAKTLPRRLLPVVSRRFGVQASYGAVTPQDSVSCPVAADSAETRKPYHLRRALILPKGRDGIEIANDPLYNKGTAFEHGERDRLGLRGMLPTRHLTHRAQINKILINLRKEPDDIHKNLLLRELLDRNETLFHRVLVENIKELAPIIYTPTVGRVCLEFGSQYRRPRGMYFSMFDRGHMQAMVHNWPGKDVQVVVVTDGSRILGLGDLGANGMGIPIGKLALYCAAGGIAPHRVLPVMLDCGTDNQQLLEDPYYLGVQQPRLVGPEYDQVVEEFMYSIYGRWPKALVQFEDFSSDKALSILNKYRNRFLCFNDDIQGTGAVTVAGLMTALRVQGVKPSDLCKQRILCAGAGSAGMGVAAALRDAMVLESNGAMTQEQAAANFFVCDVSGLIAVNGCEKSEWNKLTTEQQAFANPGTHVKRGMSLLETAKAAKPTVLLGLSACGGLFKEDLIREVAAHSPRPIIFPLSNPTASAECTAANAYKWTDGRAVFASGSPFEPVTLNGKVHTPSQCNNMFIFPGVGLGASLIQAKRVTDKMLHAASVACANSVSDEEMANGQVFPDVSHIRRVSATVATAVIEQAFAEGVASPSRLRDETVSEFVERKMYFPAYVPIIHKHDQAE